MSSPKAALRALALRCLALLRFGFQAEPVNDNGTLYGIN